MRYWWIIQSLEAYGQHPDLIGCGLKEGTDRPTHGKFSEIRKGDFVAYYATGDKVLVGVFEVVSNMEPLVNDEHWHNHAVFRLRPAVMPTEGNFVDWKKLLFDPKSSFDLFPNKERWTYTIWNHYIYELTPKDFETMRTAISSHRYEMAAEVSEKTISERMGPAFETIDLLFEPVDEMGLVYLFARHHKEIGFPFIVKLRSKYPDAIAIDAKGERKLIELEFRSSSFNHDPKGCDYIVCWIDDLEEELKEKLPPIIELSKSLSSIYSKQSSGG